MFKNEISLSKKNTSVLLQSIADHGLITPRQGVSIRGHLKGAPGCPNDIFCYNQADLRSFVHESDRAVFDETINALVFDQKEGFWAIACERSYSSDSVVHELSDAVLNSVVFLFEKALYEPGSVADNVVVFSPLNARLCGVPTHGEEHNHFHEVRTREAAAGVARSRIRAVLAPLHLIPTINRLFSDALVIPVTTEIKEMVDNPIELFITGRTAIGESILGLNYARALHMALAELGDLNTLGVHLTRCPIVIKTNKTLTIEENRELYKARCSQGKKCFRLTHLEDEKVEEIRLLEGVQLFKEHRFSPHYLCYCTALLEEQVRAIVTRDESSLAPTPASV